MAAPITRDEALELLHTHIKTDYTIKHSIATEAIMRALAPRFEGDADEWGITGLLHDLDLELVGEDPERHAHETVAMLRERGFSEAALHAILSHNGDVLDIPCDSAFDNALTSAESVTGLVFTMALILPSKKLADVKAKSVKKRMKDKRFAAKVSRERIRHYEQLGLEAMEFFTIAVEAMQSVADELGL